MTPTATILDAVAFAARRHRRQRRKGEPSEPFIDHPIAVAHLLSRHGIDDHVVLCAALLHDTVEDTRTTLEELRERFGEVIAQVVAEVTDDHQLAKAEQKEQQVVRAPHLSREAQLVKLADKIHNVSDMEHHPPMWPAARRRAYIAWSRRVVAGLRGVHAELEAAFDAAAASAQLALADEADDGDEYLY